MSGKAFPDTICYQGITKMKKIDNIIFTIGAILNIFINLAEVFLCNAPIQDILFCFLRIVLTIIILFFTLRNAQYVDKKSLRVERYSIWVLVIMSLVCLISRIKTIHIPNVILLVLCIIFIVVACVLGVIGINRLNRNQNNNRKKKE